MSNPYRDLGIAPPRDPMFLEVALKKAKEKYMTGFTTKNYDRIRGTTCKNVIDYLVANGVKDPTVTKLNAWSTQPGVWVLTVRDEDAALADGLMLDHFNPAEIAP